MLGSGFNDALKSWKPPCRFLKKVYISKRSMEKLQKTKMKILLNMSSLTGPRWIGKKLFLFESSISDRAMMKLQKQKTEICSIQPISTRPWWNAKTCRRKYFKISWSGQGHGGTLKNEHNNIFKSAGPDSVIVELQKTNTEICSNRPISTKPYRKATKM